MTDHRYDPEPSGYWASVEAANEDSDTDDDNGDAEYVDRRSR